MSKSFKLTVGAMLCLVFVSIYAIWVSYTIEFCTPAATAHKIHWDVYNFRFIGGLFMLFICSVGVLTPYISHND